ncbi:olfactory receptor 56A4-like [Pleurodeles waltl]|uniref:olfactory receptor 56A4-like n=1 Tax=Pleurodeles waltl TaxID=8319 RepID=UPI0037096A3F
MLSAVNQSNNPKSEFILVGFPGFQIWQHWLSIPLVLLFILATAANPILLATIYREQCLHEPMYYLLGTLALVDLVLSMLTTPKLLALLWFNDRTISHSACFTQMFFVHCFLGLESGIFLVMAFDRYFAICHPLSYSSVITDRFVVKAAALIFIRPLSLFVPMPFFFTHLHFCSNIVIEHSFCANLAVASLACDDTKLHNIHQLVTVGSILGLDLVLIALSYYLILRAVMKMRSKGASLKAFSTCTSHLILILFFYSILLVLSITYRRGNNVPPDVTILLNVLHLIVPPALNPMVYGVRTKEINIGIIKLFNACFQTNR